METRLVMPIAMRHPDRTRFACPAAELDAVLARGAAEMISAAMDVVALESESIDGARRETRLGGAGIAGTRAIDTRRQYEVLGEGEGAAVAVPESPIRMDEHPQRRPMHRLRFHGPALERQPRRSAEGIEGDGTELGRELTDDAPGPAVERMDAAVGRFPRCGERRPLRAPDESCQDQRAHGLAARQRRNTVLCRRMKRAAQHDSSDRSRGGGALEALGAHLRSAGAAAGFDERTQPRVVEFGLDPRRGRRCLGLEIVAARPDV